jgi:hypothetical protein
MTSRASRRPALEMRENGLEARRRLNMDDLREHKKEALRMAAWCSFVRAVDQCWALPAGSGTATVTHFCRRFLDATARVRRRMR